MRVLVTGAAGFLGTYLVTDLLAGGYQVRGLVRRISEAGVLPPDVEVAVGDVCDATAVSRAAAGCGSIVHLAAKVHVLDQKESQRTDYDATNVVGTKHVLEGAVASGASRVIFASTVKVFGEKTSTCVDESHPPKPESAYARSKWEAEQLVADYAKRGSLSTVSLRLPMVYGPTYKGNLFRMIAAIDRGRFPPLPPLNAFRSMLHVKNFTHATLLALGKDRFAKPAYVVADLKPYNVSAIYEMLCRGLGKTVPRWRTPLWSLKLVARCGDVLQAVTGYAGVVNTASLDKLIESAWFSTDAIVRDLGYCPRHSFEDAVPEMIRHYRLSRP